MKTKEFLEVLENNKENSLVFEYAPNLLVGANYHITEVKHIAIDSVDCGAQTDFWNETIIQLWESPAELGKTEFMTADKALGILNKVGKMKPYKMDSELRIEYSNATFHATQQFIGSIDISEKMIRVRLVLDQSKCKANELCGIEEEPTASINQCAPSDNCCA